MLDTPELLFAFVLVGVSACQNSGTKADDSVFGSGSTDDCEVCCEFTIGKNEVSSKIATVGVVEWSLTRAPPSSAKLVYWLAQPEGSVLNLGGEAPVNLGAPGYRTLLLGLKQDQDYKFHIEAIQSGQACVSPEYTLPTTGTYADARSVGVQVAQPNQREPGFILTSSGTSVPSSAFIIDADGDVVWYAQAPPNPSRAQMDYEGDNMWMVALNFTNDGGEMRAVSMDGERELRNVPGLDNAHHDFTVMPGGKVAALVWRNPGIDPESDLVIRSADGTLVTLFKVGSNLYRADAYHANAIHYVPFDDSFTISDRNPNLFVKVSATGTVQWQLGGLCGDTPAGSQCSAQSWQVNHGHHWLEDGTFVLFNNGYTKMAHVLEFQLSRSPSPFTATLVKDYAGDGSSSNLGDVQRLPGGNTLVTYSSEGKIVELDASWNEVQRFAIRVGYTSWRPTLYGPPTRW